MQNPNCLIDTSKVATILGISVSMCRIYKNTGIIEPCDTDGNRDLYNLDEIKWTKRRLQELRSSHTLKQISFIVEKQRARRRQKAGM